MVASVKKSSTNQCQANEKIITQQDYFVMLFAYLTMQVYLDIANNLNLIYRVIVNYLLFEYSFQQYL